MPQSEYDQLLAEWYQVLSQLWIAYGKPINETQFQFYADQLGDVNMGILEHTVDEVIKRHRFNSVPTLAEVFDVLKELHHDYKDGELYLCKTPHRDYADKELEKAVT